MTTEWSLRFAMLLFADRRRGREALEREPPSQQPGRQDSSPLRLALRISLGRRRRGGHTMEPGTQLSSRHVSSLIRTASLPQGVQTSQSAGLGFLSALPEALREWAFCCSPCGQVVLRTSSLRPPRPHRLGAGSIALPF